jgi:hypothetical protein
LNRYSPDFEAESVKTKVDLPNILEHILSRFYSGYSPEAGADTPQILEQIQHTTDSEKGCHILNRVLSRFGTDALQILKTDTVSDK